MAKTPEKKAAANVPAKTAPASTPAAMPDFMQGKGNKGVVGYRPEDLILPRIDLMQDISPRVQDGDFKSGEFVHNVLEESLGNEVKLIIFLARKQYMLWKPRHQGGGILARADDGVHWSPADAAFEVEPHKGLKKKVTWRTAKTVEQSGLANWGSTDPDDADSPPAANEMATFVALLHDRPEIGPVVVTLQRGSLTVGKKMVQRLMFSQAPITGLVFKMSAERGTNNDGQGFWTYKFTSDGFVQDQRLFDEAEKYQARFLELGFSIAGEDELQGGEDKGGNKSYDV